MSKTFRKIASFFRPSVVERRASALSQELEVAYDNGRYVLNAPNVNYSYGSLHTLFFQLFQNYRITERPINKALILGFGAGSISQLLTPLKPNVQIVGVELDPVVLSLARSYFPAALEGVRLVEADATAYLTEDEDYYDLIIVDVFVDAEVPLALQSPNFLTQLRNHMNTKALLAFNFVADTPELKQSAEHFEELFGLFFPDYEVFTCLGNRVFVSKDQ